MSRPGHPACWSRTGRNVPDVYSFEAEVWRSDGEAAWFFLTVPEDISDEIAERAGARVGFGSVRVGVRVGATAWHTSVFPDTKRRAYVLPVKRAVRTAEGLDDGSVAAVQLELR